MEICQRCQQEGHDRRTLWMACFYDMNELGLPLEQVAILGKSRRHVGEEPIEDFPPLTKQIFEDVADAKEHQYNFFTLRVCTGCRADWMNAIKDWFNLKTTRELEGEITEGAAYVRDLGANRKMTSDEIAAFKTRAT